MLSPNDATAVATQLWRSLKKESLGHERVRGFMQGTLGRPSVPEDADSELVELAKLSVLNVMPLVVDTFVDALHAVGFRDADADEDVEAWSIWQRERMDARQSGIFRPCCTYGTSYVRLIDVDGKTRFSVRSPRQMIAVYYDAEADEWPEYALDTKTVMVGGKKVLRAVLLDATHQYEFVVKGDSVSSNLMPVEGTGEPHGFDHVPVVRFLNRLDEDDTELGRGEVEPLMVEQKAINAVNFDRMVVSRFGAFPQKFIVGWAPQSADALERMSAKRLLAFEDSDVKPGHFPAANVTAYNEILAAQLAYTAVKARVQVHSITGHFSNISSDTVALIDSPNQNKIAGKRAAFGESLEQMLRAAARHEGHEVSDTAEIVWDDRQPRSLGQVVDAVQKLAASGVPVTELLDLIPGLSQAKVDAIAKQMERANAAQTAQAIVAAARSTALEPTGAVEGQ